MEKTRFIDTIHTMLGELIPITLMIEFHLNFEQCLGASTIIWSRIIATERH
jgi:hypothetical protein